jgi:hypothetical protein
MAAVGVVAGAIEAKASPKLCKAEGMAQVEQSRSYQIAPPLSEV